MSAAYVSLIAALEYQQIGCGDTHPDPEIECRARVARALAGGPTDAGCGRLGYWTVMFRCVDCGRWYHRDCLRKHFAEHTHPKAAPCPPPTTP